MSMRGVVIPGQGAGSKVKAHKTSGGGRTPVRHTIPLGIVIFLVLKIIFIKNKNSSNGSRSASGQI